LTVKGESQRRKPQAKAQKLAKSKRLTGAIASNKRSLKTLESLIEKLEKQANNLEETAQATLRKL